MVCQGRIDDFPVELLLDLYKNQVSQLARHLGVPEYVLGEAPSPDMFKGIGDEDSSVTPTKRLTRSRMW